MADTVARHIEISTDLSGGRPRIAGTRVRVQDVVVCYEFQGMTPDEIVAGYPHVTLADVHAALAYYHDRRDVIRRHIQEDEEVAARFRAQAAGRELDGDTGSVSP